jgi:hypothetical protein
MIPRIDFAWAELYSIWITGEDGKKSIYQHFNALEHIYLSDL